MGPTQTAYNGELKKNRICQIQKQFFKKAGIVVYAYNLQHLEAKAGELL